jgi:uptake hydrogenase small subunit
MQCGGCGGDTVSLLNAESPNILETKEDLDLNILWHPLFSTILPDEHLRIQEELIAGSLPLDILCVEGAVIRGPGNTGMFDTAEGRPKKDLLERLSKKAGIVIAAGTCASFGGVTGAGEADAVGLQFSKRTSGGFLGPDFRSLRGLPVINLPGCPLHASVMIGTLSALARGMELELNAFNAPQEYYNMLVHQGCTRNEYHEYRIEETDFGQKGCLFFHLGCQGPSGVPCFGCTEPDFPKHDHFFYTPNIVGLPINLPDGVNRPHYLAYKSMAAAAAPERLKHRKTEV